MPSPKSLGLSCCGLNFTKKEWLILSVLCSESFGSGVCISLQGPIYPQEAERKGATASEYGMVFGVFELVNCIFCPIYGKYMDKFGAKNLMNAGVFLAGLTTMLFGFLDLVNDHSSFIALSFLLRIMEGLGIAASFTASFSIAAILYSSNVATIFAFLECFFGFGFVLGPTIGGYFFQLGGFLCPFLVVGVLLIIDGIVIFFTLPDIQCHTDKSKPQAYISSVLKLKPVILDLISVVVIYISLGYYLATLEPHLRNLFNLSPVYIGFLFALNAAVYMITTPLVGILCDTRINPKKLMMFGFIFSIASFSLVGPFPFIPIDGALWMVYIGMISFGLATSCVVVPGFIDAIHSAIRCGLPDDIATYSLVTGLSTSAVSLGGFIGPSVAGVLSETVGFRKGTLFVIAIYILLLIAMTWFVCTEEYIPSKAARLPPQNTDYTQFSDEPAQETSAQENSAHEASAHEAGAHTPMTSQLKQTDYGSDAGQDHRTEMTNH